jgi:hypothetical protein
VNLLGECEIKKQGIKVTKIEIMGDVFRFLDEIPIWPLKITNNSFY